MTNIQHFYQNTYVKKQTRSAPEDYGVLCVGKLTFFLYLRTSDIGICCLLGIDKWIIDSSGEQNPSHTFNESLCRFKRGRFVCCEAFS